MGHLPLNFFEDPFGECDAEDAGDLDLLLLIDGSVENRHPEFL